MKHYSLLDIFASVRGTAYAFDPETGEYVRRNFAVTITPRGANSGACGWPADKTNNVGISGYPSRAPECLVRWRRPGQPSRISKSAFLTRGKERTLRLAADLRIRE